MRPIACCILADGEGPAPQVCSAVAPARRPWGPGDGQLLKGEHGAGAGARPWLSPRWERAARPMLTARITLHFPWRLRLSVR